jgi:hypothetical protein
MRVGILLLAALTFSCTGEETASFNTLSVTTTTSTSTTTTTTISKNIFSQWDQNSAPGRRLPFTGKTYNQVYRDTIFLLDLGTQCIVDILIMPNPGGHITLSTPSGTGCAGIANTYIWANTNGVLSLCEYNNSTVCTYYH